ncbi:hypothetical protein BDEG_26180 [Batrachochytrium dendrobatidis JEL423]|uniref:Uncharacterized protein n=1 Tax=Batrachochytrium dendrobatidis (strain JEL423) TaxID=403673 RepID=A0A177WSH9_BATDL|nr:hypothetical protein BDEG_26180 [Batrachochytrium dendrobatidis JEL423]
MSNLWDNVRKHTRRWSAGPAKLQIGGVLDENASHPIKMQLGDETIESGGKQARDLTERNRMLEGENQLLHFKVSVLLDMLASATLDTVQLKQLANISES